MEGCQQQLSQPLARDDSHDLARAFTLYDTLLLPKELILILPVIATISALRLPIYVKICFPPDSSRVC